MTDLSKGSIMSLSTFGIRTRWRSEKLLTDLATRYGEYAFACGSSVQPDPSDQFASFEGMCPLNGMHFVRGTKMRFATLHPGALAFSRDDGANWMPLPALGDLDRPFGAWYDPTLHPTRKVPSLYVALHGHGLIRLDAPFPTLGAITFELNGVPNGKPGPRARLVAIDETTGQSTSLAPYADGVYRGVELYDTAKVPATTIRYRYAIAPVSLEPITPTTGGRLTRVLLAGERTGGAVRINTAYADTGLP